MTDGGVTDERRQCPLVKRLRHLPHGACQIQSLAVGRGDAGALLPAMLQGIKTETRQGRRLRVPVDPEDSALVVELVHN